MIRSDNIMSKKLLVAPENTAVIYGRYSSVNQREESIEAQVRACQDYAQKNDLRIVDIYADYAKTGTNADREQFQRMIDDSAKGKFRYVIIHKLDRFSRDKYDSVTYKRKLKLNGVILRSVLENLDGSPESQILESLLEGMAAYYSQNLSRESLKGQLENAHKCIHTGGFPPLGYDVDKESRAYVINEKEAEIVRYIFSQYAEGTGYNKIIAHLNDQGFHSKQGRPFGKNSLKDLLQNRKYMGIYTFNMRFKRNVAGKRTSQFKSEDDWICIKGGMPAIVDEDTFQKVQTQLVSNKKYGGRQKAKNLYLLSGLIRCGECGASMYGKSHKDGRHGRVYLSYECSNKNYTRTCKNKEIRKEYIENYVLDQLYLNLFSDHSIEKLSSMLSDYSRKMSEKHNDELSLALQELDEINGKISKIILLVSESGISIETVKEELKQLDERKRTVEKYIQDLRLDHNAIAVSEETLTDLIFKSKEFVENKDVSECRKIIGDYIDKVAVSHNLVQISYKIHVPDSDEENFTLLQSEGDVHTIKKTYRKLDSFRVQK